MKKDLHELPKLRDSISYIYIERAVIEQDAFSIVILRQNERIPVPAAATTCLLLGPGTRITHAAIKVLSECGCLVVWCGERMQRFHAAGMGETRSSDNLLRQAELCMDPVKHLEVVKKMYEIRFPRLPPGNYSIEQYRGMEGIRIREAYKLASRVSGVTWKSRNYKNGEWDETDPLNRALSEGNSILYGLCHAAIVSLGYSPGLGFVHTGKMLSFVYDIADLYKTETTIPAAFEAVKAPGNDLEKTVRMLCRDRFAGASILKRIPSDIFRILFSSGSEQRDDLPAGELWDEAGPVSGGINHAGEV